MLRFLVAIALSTLVAYGAAAATKIYKTVDENGNVVFTDVPQGDRGSEVSVEPANTFPSAERDANDGATAAEGEALAEQRYGRLQITTPEHDAAIRENAGNLFVEINLDPELADGHSLQLYMDGVLQTSATITRYALENVDRGTHELVAQVVDQKGSVLIASEPVTFHMLRHSKLMRKAPPPPSGGSN